MEKIEVNALWNEAGKPQPSRFKWKGTVYDVETTGRQWNDEDGYHILCSVKEKGTFELIYQEDQGWYLDYRPPNRHYV